MHFLARPPSAAGILWSPEFASFGWAASPDDRSRCPTPRTASGRIPMPPRSQYLRECFFAGLLGRLARCSCWRITIREWRARNELWDEGDQEGALPEGTALAGGASAEAVRRNWEVLENDRPICQASCIIIWVPLSRSWLVACYIVLHD